MALGWNTHQQHGLFVEQLLLQDLQVSLLLLQLPADVLLSVKQTHYLSVAGPSLPLFQDGSRLARGEREL